MTPVPGFEVGRLLGHGPLGAVHEARQTGLDRRVALRLLGDDPALGERLRRLSWPEHDRAADLYAVGARDGGFFLARQHVDGPTVAALPARRALPVLRDAAAALDAAHAAGIVHGSVTAANVLVDRDGRGVLCDFGLHADARTTHDDLVAFAALVAASLGDPAGAATPVHSATAIVDGAASRLARRRRRRRLLAAVAAAAAASAVAVLGATTREDDDGPPAILAGTEALGSALSTRGETATLDCDGHPPDGASQACTILQTRLPGHPLAARRAGVVRRFTVRRAHGELVLAVLRARGSRYEVTARSDAVTVAGDRSVDVDLPIGAGDVVGLELTPGTGVGLRRAPAGAATARWVGPLALDPRAPDRTGRPGEELLLRVEYEPGARWRPPGVLEGAAAASAPSGEVVATERVTLPGGARRTVALVRARSGVAVDLFRGARRTVRLPVRGAAPRGRLDAIETLGRPLLSLRWRNPDGRQVRREYRVLTDGLTPLR